MRINRDGLSTLEMENIVKIRDSIRESCLMKTINSEELAEIVQGLNAPFASLITILSSRRAKLKKLLKAIERERAKVNACLDTTNLSAPANIESFQRLEKLINDYCFLNEGLRRARGGRRPTRARKRTDGRSS